VRPFLQEVGAKGGRLRIAFTSRTPLGTDVHPDCVAAVRDAAALCNELGHEVVEAAPVFNAEWLWQSFTTVLSAGFSWGIADWGRRTGRKPTAEFFEPFVWAFTQKGLQIRAPEYLLALQDLQKLTRDIARFFINYDIWLTPTLGEPPVPLGTFKFLGGDPFELRRRIASFSPYTYISNATGQPAMSVPLYWNGEGLPVGTHFVARFGDEATLFRLAAQLEEARPWMNRRPPVSA
jgi:amidase